MSSLRLRQLSHQGRRQLESKKQRIKSFLCTQIRQRTFYDYLVLVGLTIVLLHFCQENVFYMIGKYLAYDTAVSMDNQLPTVIDFPGVTVCAPSILTPAMLASQFASKVQEATRTNASLFCRIVPTIQRFIESIQKQANGERFSQGHG